MKNDIQTASISDYIDCFDESWTDQSTVDDVRFVVLDTETTGLDPRRDRLITIGAVAVKDSQIVLDDSFEALLRLDFNRSSVTVHGVTREEAQAGGEEREVLELLLPYLKDGVIVGHHILHDIETLNCAYDRHFGITLRNRFLDTMDLALNLQEKGAFGEGNRIDGFSLDALCDFFGVAPHDRHTAGGDAFITALIFLRLLCAAQKCGQVTLGELSKVFVAGEEREA